MKKIAILFTFALFAMSCTKGGQTSGSGSADTNVRAAAAEYGHYSEPLSFDVYKIAKISNDPIMDGAETAGVFYPIGWSEDGKFAYALFSGEHDFVGECADFKVFIQDMASDKVVWEYKYFNDGGNGDIETFSQVWKAHQDEIYDNLGKYKIVQSGDVFCALFPFQYEQKAIDIVIETSDKDTDEFFTTINYKIIATKAGVGSKVISQSEGSDPVSDVSVLGYFPNSYEPRIAVILIESHAGFEGTKYLTLKLVGCKLNSGF